MRVELSAGRTAQELNRDSLGADAGIARTIARAWLSIMEAGFLAVAVPAWSPNARKRAMRSCAAAVRRSRPSAATRAIATAIAVLSVRTPRCPPERASALHQDGGVGGQGRPELIVGAEGVSGSGGEQDTAGAVPLMGRQIHVCKACAVVVFPQARGPTTRRPAWRPEAPPAPRRTPRDLDHIPTIAFQRTAE
ncbi:MAG: DUF4143 domain-containing protein [Sporichthyaceae bacterium]